MTIRIVVYHKNCTDGKGAALCAWRKFPYAHFIECNYGKEQEEFVSDLQANWGLGEIDEMYIVDFSFKRGQLNTLARYANKVVVLDHHETAQQELMEPMPDVGEGHWQRHSELAATIEVLFDMERSGAQIAWDYFEFNIAGESRMKPRPDLIEMIGLRDLWKHKGHPREEEAEAVHLALNSAPFVAEEWNDLIKRPAHYIEFAQRGIAIRKFFHARVEEMCEHKWQRVFTLDGKNWLLSIVNAPYYFVSEVGEFCREPGYITLIWSHSPKSGEVICSLRSASDVRANDFAKLFGGGGHPQAAGFKLPFNQFYEQFLSVLHK
jgi:oligoribonuclease NrnB/cAMP/cGMP phosphodiesterase (DHH superfamily)